MIFNKVDYRSLFDLCIICLQHCNTPSGICSACQKDLPWLEARCAICALPLTATNHDTLCGPCLKKKPAFTHVDALFLYKFPIDHFIGKIKYSGKTQYIGHLAELLSTHGSLPIHADALVPVPMHRFNLYKRGFNQAELLALELGKKFNMNVETRLLKKTQLTRRQMTLTRDERLKNQHNVFKCIAPPHRHIVLVDDVMTTGATLDAAAQTLLSAGAERVDAIVLARTPK
ncbi:ComF family protein [Neptuniibacter pectenicola]|uniref:ComF family protein n=1 Tax=Neptuniibacter pectenicola TaxID=1806669 RepID=UPI0030EB5057|tara:strand:+ start:865 stop:1554 length:690 start_codon:yes stop_codon:yes gene_type:complete